MISAQQETQQCDIKAPSINSSTDRMPHIFLLILVMMSLLAVYVLINTPSASIANLDEINIQDNFMASNSNIVATSIVSELDASRNLPPQLVATINASSINQNFFVRARKSHLENRSMYDLPESLPTNIEKPRLTPQERKKIVDIDAIDLPPSGLQVVSAPVNKQSDQLNQANQVDASDLPPSDLQLVSAPVNKQSDQLNQVDAIDLPPSDLQLVSAPVNKQSDQLNQVDAIDLPPSGLQVVSAPVNKQSDQLNQTSEADGSQIRLTTYLQSQPWITTKVRSGDSLSKIFKRNGLHANDAYQLVRLNEAKVLLKIQPGQEIKLKKDKQGEFALLQYQPNIFDILTVRFRDDKFVAEVTKRTVEIRLNNTKATIHQHLLGAAKKARVSLSTTYKFIAIFGWQVDFTMDIRAGDQFSVIYEERYIDDKKIGDGDIIAAELIISGKVLQAIQHKDEYGVTNYYTPEGSGMKGAFLRTPLKFGHVTSVFSNNRLHPIKKIWRAHKGVDYGAPRGTPVRATGDGTVRIAKRNGDYGKTIIVRHGGKYDTVYAHLSAYARGIRSGAHVKQGEIIGYVGSTGLATGPHLHYEFRINGVHKNPMTVALPKSTPIAEKYKSQFQQAAMIWVAELEYLNRIPLAQNYTDQQSDFN